MLLLVNTPADQNTPFMQQMPQAATRKGARGYPVHGGHARRSVNVLRNHLPRLVLSAVTALSLTWAAPVVLRSQVATSTGLETQTSIPLVLGSTEVGENRRVLTLMVSNTSNKRITAWTIEVRFQASDGTAVRLRQDDDGFLAADLPSSTLAPGAVRPIRVGLPSGYVESSTMNAWIAACVFEDLSSAGDSTAVDRIMSRRVTERDELLHWREELKSKLVQHAGIAVLPDGTRVRDLPSARKSVMTAETIASAVPAAGRIRAIEALRAAIESFPTRTRLTGRLRVDLARMLEQRDSAVKAQQAREFTKLLDLECSNAALHSRRAQ